jgi:hypothetical protein
MMGGGDLHLPMMTTLVRDDARKASIPKATQHELLLSAAIF